MTTTDRRCQARNPETCPYHGAQATIARLKDINTQNGGLSQEQMAQFMDASQAIMNMDRSQNVFKGLLLNITKASRADVERAVDNITNPEELQHAYETYQDLRKQLKDSERGNVHREHGYEPDAYGAMAEAFIHHPDISTSSLRDALQHHSSYRLKNIIADTHDPRVIKEALAAARKPRTEAPEQHAVVAAIKNPATDEKTAESILREHPALAVEYVEARGWNYRNPEAAERHLRTFVNHHARGGKRYLGDNPDFRGEDRITRAQNLLIQHSDAVTAQAQLTRATQHSLGGYQRFFDAEATTAALLANKKISYSVIAAYAPALRASPQKMADGLAGHRGVPQATLDILNKPAGGTEYQPNDQSAVPTSPIHGHSERPVGPVQGLHYDIAGRKYATPSQYTKIVNTIEGAEFAGDTGPENAGYHTALRRRKAAEDYLSYQQIQDALRHS